MKDWYIFRGPKKTLPEAPPWRRFAGEVLKAKDSARQRLPAPSSQEERRGRLYQADGTEIEMVNAALVLRRPLLVTGKPGTGKSSLAYAVAHDLGLGPVLRWSITSRATLKDGLYTYDVLGRLQEQQLHPGQPPDIGKFLRLGPLGTALAPYDVPRVLLIDELDKSDVDLPNDLLHVFEEGRYDIPELARLPNGSEPLEIRAHDDGHWIPIVGGRVQCKEFPFVVMTSNGERDFPPAFLRRCLRVTIPEPPPERLAAIAEAQLAGEAEPKQKEEWRTLFENFKARRNTQDLATDQLLNALYLRIVGAPLGAQNTEEGERLENALFKPLTGAQAT